MTNKKPGLTVQFNQACDTVNESPTKKRQFFHGDHLRKIKAVTGHLGLLITLMLYTAIGGLVSRILALRVTATPFPISFPPDYLQMFWI